MGLYTFTFVLNNASKLNFFSLKVGRAKTDVASSIGSDKF